MPASNHCCATLAAFLIRPQSPMSKPTPPTARNLWAVYMALIKARLLSLVIFSTGLGYYLGAVEFAGWAPLLSVLVGVALVGAGANGLNQWYERRVDVLMRRTSGRPLPDNHITAYHALSFCVSLSLAGFAILWKGTNLLTLSLSVLSWFTYLFIYTPLKRVSLLNTWLGAVPGALPALLGYTTSSGVVDNAGLALFSVLYLWQMPHFFAISWVYREDYSQAGFRMLSLDDVGGARTAAHIMLHTVLMVLASITVYLYSPAGWLYAAGAGIGGVASLVVAIGFWRDRSIAEARRVFRLSLLYLPLIFASLVIDRLLIG